MDWGLIVQATCGLLSRKKYYASINSSKFVRGKAVLNIKKARELPVKVVMIPQLDGNDVPTSKNILGVLTNMAGEREDQLTRYVKKV